MNDQRTALKSSKRRTGLIREARRALTENWQTSKTYFFGGLLILLTTLVVVVYYLNHPQPEQYPDSVEYLNFARLIQMQGHIIDAHRVPGFPLLITLAFALTGKGNVLAVSIANAILFIISTLEIYVIALLLLRKSWSAFLIGLLVGTNVILMSFVKPLTCEALALWLLVTVALAASLFVCTLRARYLWIITAFTLGLFFTRPEWIYVPVPLFAYLVLVAARQGSPIRHLLMHSLMSVVLLYAALGGYIFINASQNHFVGVTDIQNANTLGKVLQYNMQNEASPQYKRIAQVANTFRSHGDINPYELLEQQPWLNSNHYALIGEFSQSIIMHHPAEFLAKSVPLLVTSPGDFYYESQADPQGPFGGALLVMQNAFHILYKLNILFPLCAAALIFLLFWRRTAHLRSVQAMGAVAFLVLYGLVLTTLGGYGSYIRLHIPFNPLLIVIIWGGLLAVLQLLAARRSHGIAQDVTTLVKQLAARS